MRGGAGVVDVSTVSGVAGFTGTATVGKRPRVSVTFTAGGRGPRATLPQLPSFLWP